MDLHIDLLRKEPGILKLFILLKEKYRSLGHVGGTVPLGGFSDQELEAIAGLTGSSPDKLKEKRRITLHSFEKALEETVFAEYPLIVLIEKVLGEKIATKKEEAERAKEGEAAFFRSMQETWPEMDWWWERILMKSVDTRWIWGLYRQDRERLMNACSLVSRAFLSLPADGAYERMPLFAQRITGNPHRFDHLQTEGKLLIHCLYTDQLRKGVYQGQPPRTSEELNELLGRYGLMRDDLWSFVTCQGLLAESDDGIHPVWEAAVRSGTVMNVPIKELAKLEKVWPAKGESVWIVENSSVCSTLSDRVPGAPLVCTHGQFRTASWALLDLLASNSCTLYYSGDLDPEGLVMAQRLKSRYGGQLLFWRMNENAYNISASEEDISSRLAQLDTIEDPDLLAVAKLMRMRKKAGYQEGLVDVLAEDMGVAEKYS